MLQGNRQFDISVVRELHRVRQQVGQHLPQAQRVTHQGTAVANQLRSGHGVQQFNALLLRRLAYQQQALACYILDPEASVLQFQPARLHLGEIQYVVDDAEQGLCRRVNLVDVVVLARVQSAAQRQIGHAQNGVHRRADFVAHVGQETRFRVGCVLRLLSRHLQLPLNRMAPANIVLDGVRHQVHRSTQSAQLIESMQTANAGAVVPRCQLVRALAQPFQWNQHVPADAAQGQHPQDNRRRHADQRQQYPALQRRPRDAHFGAGAPINHAKQRTDRS